MKTFIGLIFILIFGFLAWNYYIEKKKLNFFKKKKFIANFFIDNFLNETIFKSNSNEIYAVSSKNAFLSCELEKNKKYISCIFENTKVVNCFICEKNSFGYDFISKLMIDLQYHDEIVIDKKFILKYFDISLSEDKN